MTQTVEHAPEPTEATATARGGNGIGIAAFVMGALGLAPVALILGIVGLARYRAGKASRRSWALAGVILGAVGLIAGVAIGVVYATSSAPAIAQDAHAKVDVVNLGNAVVDWYVAHPDGDLPPVVLADDGYLVDGAAVPGTIDRAGDHGVILEAPSAYSWCLTLEYSGGTEDSVGFSATEGLVASCPAA